MVKSYELQKNFTVWKERLLLHPKRIKACLAAILSLLLLIFGYWLSRGDEPEAVKVDTAPHIQMAEFSDNKNAKNKGRLVYSAGDDGSALKNPFSFAHETAQPAKAKPPAKAVVSDLNVVKPIPSKEIVKSQGDKRETDKNRHHKIYVLKAVIDIGGRKTAVVSSGGKDFRAEVGSVVGGDKITALDKTSMAMQHADGSSEIYALHDTAEG